MTTLAISADGIKYIRGLPSAVCACGCGRPLPALRTAHRKYHSRACSNRVYYHRSGARQQGKMPWAERRRLGIKKRGLVRDARGRFASKARQP